jgi:uncharacterized protein (TIGR00730 family)
MQTSDNYTQADAVSADSLNQYSYFWRRERSRASTVHYLNLFTAGGYGTLEELLEVIAWAQLGIHDKPVGLLNVDGYYNSLLSFIDKAVEEEFISPSARHIIVLAPTPKELLEKLEVYILIYIIYRFF